MFDRPTNGYRPVGSVLELFNDVPICVIHVRQIMVQTCHTSYMLGWFESNLSLFELVGTAFGIRYMFDNLRTVTDG